MKFIHISVRLTKKSIIMNFYSYKSEKCGMHLFILLELKLCRAIATASPLEDDPVSSAHVQTEFFCLIGYRASANRN